MTSPEQSAVAGRATRVSLDAQVRMQPADQGEIRHALAGNVSLTGMFIRTQQPYPAGSLVQFELSQGDGPDPIRGVGHVVWIRFEDEGPVRPAGMGLRFRWIDPDSRDAFLRRVDPQGRFRGERKAWIPNATSRHP